MATTNKSKDKKTDNSYLADKVGLRVAHLPKGKVTVLDCYAGTGRIWRAVKRRTGREIRILAMDKRNLGFHMPGDNISWILEMDLSRFNVIDLDAYGVPYEQLRAIIRKGYRGTVFVTFIQSIWGKMPKDLLIDVGFTEAMIEKAPALCNSRGWEYLLDWLAMNGIEKIFCRSHGRKHYFAFKM